MGRYTMDARPLEFIPSDGVARVEQEGQDERWRNTLAQCAGCTFQESRRKKFNGGRKRTRAGPALGPVFLPGELRAANLIRPKRPGGVNGLGAGPAAEGTDKR